MSSSSARRPGAFRVGSLVGVDVFVSTSWIFIAVLLSIALSDTVERAQPGLGNLKYLGSVAFVILFYLSVLLHEISHAVMAKRFEFGSARWCCRSSARQPSYKASSNDPVKFWVAIVGPVTSLLVGAACIPLAILAPEGLLQLAATGLAGTNIFVGLLNLVPGLPFDGGQVLRSGIWAASGDQHRSTVIAGWCGRVIAVILGTAPVWLRLLGYQLSTFNLVLLPVLALFLWTAASSSIMSASIRMRLPNLRARELARRVVQLPADLAVSEAVGRAQVAGAGGIVTVDTAGRPLGIVVEQALNAVPDERRPWTTISMVSRTLEPGLSLAADLEGETLIRAMQATPATEYLLTETDGAIFGVLTTADVDRAFAATR